MATVKRVEGQVYRVEGFDITMRHLRDRRNARDDLSKLPPYTMGRMPGAKNVADWKRRFRRKYPGFRVDVLDPDGYLESGNKLLRNVRDEYR
jgi:hypothetical protein